MGILKLKLTQSKLSKINVPIEFTGNEAAQLLALYKTMRMAVEVRNLKGEKNKQVIRGHKDMMKILNVAEEKLIHAILKALGAPANLENWDALKNIEKEEE